MPFGTSIRHEISFCRCNSHTYMFCYSHLFVFLFRFFLFLLLLLNPGQITNYEFIYLRIHFLVEFMQFFIAFYFQFSRFCWFPSSVLVSAVSAYQVKSVFINRFSSFHQSVENYHSRTSNQSTAFYFLKKISKKKSNFWISQTRFSAEQKWFVPIVLFYCKNESQQVNFYR